MNCGVIPTKLFEERVVQAALAARVPISGTIELTELCNLRCIHCYIGERGKLNAESFPYGLSKEEVIDLLDQLLEAGCLWLLLSGGEPLVRPDFCEIYLEAAKRGFILTVFTNGTLIRDEHLDLWKRFPPRKIEVSLYGATPETYEAMAGSARSCELVYAAIDRMVRQGLSVKLKTNVVDATTGDLDRMRAFAESRELEFVADSLIFGLRDDNRCPTDLRIPVDAVVNYYRSDKKVWERSREALERYLQPASEPEDDLLYTCGAGRLTFCITARGKLNVCALSRRPQYDLRSGPFLEGWRTVVREVIETKRPKNHPCGGCPLRPVCPTCPATAELEHGDPFGKIEYFCEVSHKVAECLTHPWPAEGDL